MTAFRRNLAASHDSLGALLSQTGKLADAEPLYQRCLRICDKTPRANDRDLAQSLHGLAQVCVDQAKFAEAEKLFQRGLKTTENAKETLERTLAHLKDNGVDMASTKLQVGPVLPFDPQSETFPGNEKANAMLTRDYRKPFVVPPAGQV